MLYHPIDNRTVEKRKQMLESPDGPNPFVDPGEWKQLIDRLRGQMAQIMADNDK